MPNNNQAAIVSLNELPEYKYVNEDKEYDQSIHSVTLVKSSSTDSISSMYSAAAGKGDYDITGKVELGVWYSNGQLFVHVMKAKGLKQGRLSNPYVKIYLLPDHGKQSKRRTGIQQKTSNPIFDEVLKVMASLHINGNIKMSFVLFFLNHCQIKVEQDDLSCRTLWLSVWDWDKFGRNQFLGQLQLSLSSLDLTNKADHWYTLTDEVSSYNIHFKQVPKSLIII